MSETMMIQQSITLLRVLLAILGFGWAASTAQSAEDVTELIEKAWRAREEKVRSAEFTFTSSTLYPKGGFSSVAPDAASAMPPEDILATCQHRYVIDDTRVRVEVSGLQWSGDDFRHIETTTVLNGKRKTQIEIGSESAPRGRITSDTDYFEVKGQHCRPMTRAFRSHSRTMRTFGVEELKPSRVKSVIGGRTCEQFVLHRVNGRHSDYWLDPNRDWVIVREIHRYSSGMTVLDTEYEADPTCGWVPKSWEFRDTPKSGPPVCVTKYTMVAYRLNLTVPEDTFRVTFPVGTEVIDSSTGQLDDYTVPAEQVVTLNPTQDGATQRRWLFVILGGLGALVVIGLLFLFSRKRRIQATSARLKLGG